MLIRMVGLVGIWLLPLVSGWADEDTAAGAVGLPNVFVLICDSAPKVEDQSVASYYWAVPGRLPNFAAFLYGKTPLECGVVSDWDWRRKPVEAESLADSFRKAGYHTGFFGEWGLGDAFPYNPGSRGFDTVWMSADKANATLEDMVLDCGEVVSKVKLIESMPQDKPWFCVFRYSGSEEEGKLLMHSVFHEANGKFGGVVLFVSRSGVVVLPNREMADLGAMPEMHPQSVWEISGGLKVILGVESQKIGPYFFYHNGNWPLTDSPEKYRHRGSLVMGEKFALADGLKLYPILDPLVPDLKHPLDLAEHATEHQTLLKAHGGWWSRASKAIHNPRPFSVGEKDQQVVTLTALDWRPTKILHKDGSALASDPMVYRSRLLATLRGIRDNEDYKESFPAYSGSWSVKIVRAGRYKITARLLPKDGVDPSDEALAKLQGGQAHIKLGRNEVQLKLMKGATSVSVLLDADAGVTDLECWFVGQLALERELGAFFVDVERVGEKKFELNLKTQAK